MATASALSPSARMRESPFSADAPAASGALSPKSAPPPPAAISPSISGSDGGSTQGPDTPASMDRRYDQSGALQDPAPGPSTASGSLASASNILPSSVLRSASAGTSRSHVSGAGVSFAPGTEGERPPESRPAPLTAGASFGRSTSSLLSRPSFSSALLARTSAMLKALRPTLRPAIRRGGKPEAAADKPRNKVTFFETATVIEFVSSPSEREMRKPYRRGCCTLM
ncbi:hypothetical protein H632_c2166p0 [Helicosporidium sp. ATCC 50920]|nr:hypothetical protein H632_c2166p0 [Helicosporidium sp. ATCC 50920]|eukprot:KDD73450.1 hypothetical protein H632_c2166p0 [Helicosporidium sp. ATCC 50920]